MKMIVLLAAQPLIQNCLTGRAHPAPCCLGPLQTSHLGRLWQWKSTTHTIHQSVSLTHSDTGRTLHHLLEWTASRHLRLISRVHRPTVLSLLWQLTSPGRPWTLVVHQSLSVPSEMPTCPIKVTFQGATAMPWGTPVLVQSFPTQRATLMSNMLTTTGATAHIPCMREICQLPISMTFLQWRSWVSCHISDLFKSRIINEFLNSCLIYKCCNICSSFIYTIYAVLVFVFPGLLTLFSQWTYHLVVPDIFILPFIIRQAFKSNSQLTFVLILICYSLTIYRYCDSGNHTWAVFVLFLLSFNHFCCSLLSSMHVFSSNPNLKINDNSDNLFLNFLFSVQLDFFSMILNSKAKEILDMVIKFYRSFSFFFFSCFEKIILKN